MGSIHNLGSPADNGLAESITSPRKGKVQPGEDQVQLATVPLSAEVEQIQSKDPSSFQAVMADAIHKLRVAASESSNPIEAAFLSQLANRFQALEEAGNGGAPADPVQNPST
jgi:hypothetical protein